MTLEKLIKEGKTAVMYSPGYGAGWSTWNREHAAALCMDRELAEAVVSGDLEKAKEVVDRKWPGTYLGGLRDLCVEWVPVGHFFEVYEYDGNESLRILGEIEFMQA